MVFESFLNSVDKICLTLSFTIDKKAEVNNLFLSSCTAKHLSYISSFISLCSKAHQSVHST